DRLAIVQVPPGLARLVQTSQPGVFVLLDEVITVHLQHLFPGQELLESAAIRLARDAELELDDEGGRTHLEQVEHELRRRRRGSVARLEIAAHASPQLLAVLRQQLEVAAEDVYRIPGPLDLRVLMGLADLPGLDALRDPRRQPADALAGLHHTDL